MTSSHRQTISTSERLSNLVAEAFQVATIAMVSVVGILTVAGDASSVGEGSVVVSKVWEYLNQGV